MKRIVFVWIAFLAILPAGVQAQCCHCGGREVVVSAHRGGAGLKPENTIEAMINAINLGCRSLEGDLHITKDGKIVFSHDPYLLGFGNQYLIYKHTYDELRAHKPDLPLASELIDSVESYCRHQGIAPVDYTLEIKSVEGEDGIITPEYHNYTDAVMRLLLSEDLGKRLLMQSFDFRVLKYLHSRYPQVRQMALVEAKHVNLADVLKELGYKPDVFSCNYEAVDSALVADCHDNGITLNPYTVNDLNEALRLISLGVDGIITNYPNKMLRLKGTR